MERSHFAPFREKCFQHLHHLNRVRSTLRKPCAVADGQVCAERVQLVAHSAGAAREDERFGFVAAQTGTPRNVPTTAPPAAQTCGRNDAGTPMRAAASARNAFRTGSNSPSDAAFDGCITGAAAPVRRIAR